MNKTSELTKGNNLQKTEKKMVGGEASSSVFQTGLGRQSKSKIVQAKKLLSWDSFQLILTFFKRTM